VILYFKCKKIVFLKGLKMRKQKVERKGEKSVRNRTEQIQQRIEQMPESQRKTYLKASQGKGSPRNAIKAFCSECVGYSREEVTLCTDVGCPLYLFRPFKNGSQNQ